MTHTYSLYVGTTPTHDAHGTPIVELPRDLTWGVWDGQIERVAVHQINAYDDASATRSARQLAIATGNDAVMVVRDASRTGVDARDTRYRVRAYVVSEGNRTLHDGAYGDGQGYRFSPDPKGDEVAYLVYQDGSRLAVWEPSLMDGVSDTWIADTRATPNSDGHVCDIDCERVPTATGGVAHVLYPSTPNGAAGRYQAAQNVGITRREYRASGQDESRACRVWAAERAARGPRVAYRNAWL